jgi:hypothetical protein
MTMHATPNAIFAELTELHLTSMAPTGARMSVDTGTLVPAVIKRIKRLILPALRLLPPHLRFAQFADGN